MPQRPEAANAGVEHGRWGEDVAVEHLRSLGYVIVERNSRPCRWDRRLEIDVVAYDRKTDTMVFVEVKQHKAHSDRERRLRSIDRRKLDLLRKACRAWTGRNRWRGARRFDVVEVFGEPGGRAEIDHVERVRLFERPDRYVNWAE
ncbi:MAG: YraN family protein [Kiritimatiellae bacterium]|nr:YraN family protein [Kiritimatiellia bacterium]